MRDTLGIIEVLYFSIQFAGSLMQFLILIRVVFSWLRVRPVNGITKFIYNITELILLPIRNLINRMGMASQTISMDFSPLIAILFLQVFNSLLIKLIQMIASNLYG